MDAVALGVAWGWTRHLTCLCLGDRGVVPGLFGAGLIQAFPGALIYGGLFQTEPVIAWSQGLVVVWLQILSTQASHCSVGPWLSVPRLQGLSL